MPDLPTATAAKPSLLHAAFAVRMVYVDHYMGLPLNKDGSLTVSGPGGGSPVRVPIIRVFGSTPAGQKCCVHVHGVFPYVYIHVPHALLATVHADPDGFTRAVHAQLEAAVQASLQKAPGVASGGGAEEGPRGHPPPSHRRARVVRNVHLVRGIPFYGHWTAGAGCGDASVRSALEEDETYSHRFVTGHLFLRVVLYNPALIRRAAAAFQDGSLPICGNVGGGHGSGWQPYESHVPFLLQFYVDHNLAGMSLLAAKHVLFRHPLPASATPAPYRSALIRARPPISTVWPTLAARWATPAAATQVGGDGQDGWGPTPPPYAVLHRLWLAHTTPPQFLHRVPPPAIASVDMAVAVVGRGARVGLPAARVMTRDSVGGWVDGVTGRRDDGGGEEGEGAVAASWPSPSPSGVEGEVLANEWQGWATPVTHAPAPPAAAAFRLPEGLLPHQWGIHRPGDAYGVALAGAGGGGSEGGLPATGTGPALVYLPSGHPAAHVSKCTTCELEGDVWATDVLNGVEREQAMARSAAAADRRRRRHPRSTVATPASLSAPMAAAEEAGHATRGGGGDGGEGEEDDVDEDGIPYFAYVLSLRALWEEERARRRAEGASPSASPWKRGRGGGHTLSETQRTGTISGITPSGSGDKPSGSTATTPVATLGASGGAWSGLPPCTTGLGDRGMDAGEDGAGASIVDLDAAMEYQLQRMVSADRVRLMSALTGAGDVGGAGDHSHAEAINAWLATLPPARHVSYGEGVEAEAEARLLDGGGGAMGGGDADVDLLVGLGEGHVVLDAASGHAAAGNVGGQEGEDGGVEQRHTLATDAGGGDGASGGGMSPHSQEAETGSDPPATTYGWAGEGEGAAAGEDAKLMAAIRTLTQQGPWGRRPSTSSSRSASPSTTSTASPSPRSPPASPSPRHEPASEADIVDVAVGGGAIAHSTPSDMGEVTSLPRAWATPEVAVAEGAVAGDAAMPHPCASQRSACSGSSGHGVDGGNVAGGALSRQPSDVAATQLRHRRRAERAWKAIVDCSQWEGTDADDVGGGGEQGARAVTMSKPPSPPPPPGTATPGDGLAQGGSANPTPQPLPVVLPVVTPASTPRGLGEEGGDTPMAGMKRRRSRHVTFSPPAEGLPLNTAAMPVDDDDGASAATQPMVDGDGGSEPAPQDQDHTPQVDHPPWPWPSPSTRMYRTTVRMPPAARLSGTWVGYGLQPVVHVDAHYSIELDVPARPPVFAGLAFRVPGTTIRFLPPFDTTPTVELARWAARHPGQLATAAASMLSASTTSAYLPPNLAATNLQARAAGQAAYFPPRHPGDGGDCIDLRTPPSTAAPMHPPLHLCLPDGRPSPAHSVNTTPTDAVIVLTSTQGGGGGGGGGTWARSGAHAQRAWREEGALIADAIILPPAPVGAEAIQGGAIRSGTGAMGGGGVLLARHRCPAPLPPMWPVMAGTRGAPTRMVVRWAQPMPAPAAVARSLAVAPPAAALAQVAPAPPPTFDANTGAIIAMPTRRDAAPPPPAPLATPPATATEADALAADLVQHLTVMALEVATVTRGKLLPDPKHDAIVAVGWVVHDDGVVAAMRRACTTKGDAFRLPQALVVGAVVVDEGGDMGEGAGGGWNAYARGMGLGDRVHVIAVPNEMDLITAVVRVVREWDPDMVVGYDVQRASWGYVLERGAALGIPLPPLLSRTPTTGIDRRHGQDDWGDRHDSDIWLAGRTVLNAWRLMRSELKLGVYTLHAVAHHVLGVRVPHFSHATLTRWWVGVPQQGGGMRHWRWRVVGDAISRASLVLHLLDEVDLVGRTSEMARLFGFDFFSVLSRGSQFRVEAVMLRVSHPLDYLAPSASRSQVARQAAMEVVPLIMEPQSRIYPDPVVVLDFVSLYPSVIIAYNMCYSTALGRLAPGSPTTVAGSGRLGWNPRLGFLAPATPTGLLATAHGGMWEGTAIRRLERPVGGGWGAGDVDVEGSRPRRPTSIYLSPNGTCFVPWTCRQGILPRMLSEILDTRAMLKAAMERSEVVGDPVRLRQQHARQFALKMIANVTYGYTAAGFSGRMPCAEIADAIVQSGRTTLERAIRLVESHPTWRARVVYGDTDSMFVHLPGRSVADAAAIGAAIAAEVTSRNPRPVTLKFDKVYHPCALVAKKRYVGLIRKPSQPAPAPAQPHPLARPGVLDCKGLEMVRRDSCGLVAGAMARALWAMFTTLDLSTVKAGLVALWSAMLEGRVSVGEYLFAKEVRLGSYSDRGPLPPAAIVASKAMMVDPRATPRWGERVPFVVVTGPPRARLVDLVIPPGQLVAAPALYRLNQAYYIHKQIIPALDRVLSLAGGDVKAWFGDMGRPRGMASLTSAMPVAGGGVGRGTGGNTRTLETYYAARACNVCGGRAGAGGMCDACHGDEQRVGLVTTVRQAAAEAAARKVMALCQSCSGVADVEDWGHPGVGGGGGASACEAMDCPVYYERVKLCCASSNAMKADSCSDKGSGAVG